MKLQRSRDSTVKVLSYEQIDSRPPHNNVMAAWRSVEQQLQVDSKMSWTVALDTHYIFPPGYLNGAHLTSICKGAPR